MVVPYRHAASPEGLDPEDWAEMGDLVRRALRALTAEYRPHGFNVGINVGVAAPMAYFPFSGWKDSFFGDLHAQGRDAIDFYTEKKVVVERWPSTWSRKF